VALVVTTRYKPAMAMNLPLRPTPFFGNKNRAFWRLQLLGWGGDATARVVQPRQCAARFVPHHRADRLDHRLLDLALPFR